MQSVEPLAHVSAMSYLSLGSQTPFQTSHLVSGQQTASIAANCKDDSTIAILRPSVRSFLSKMACRNVTLLLVNYQFSFSEEECRLIEKHPIRRVFAHHVLSSLSCQVTPIPVGIPFHRHPPGTRREIDAQIGRLSRVEWRRRRPQILVTHLGKTHALRQNAMDILHKTDPTIRSLFHFERRRLGAAEYYSSLGAFRYVFAPRGAGFDTFRAWETISVGGCPILVEDKDCSTLVFEGTCAVLVSRMEDLTDPGFVFGLLNRSSRKSPSSTKQLVSHWRREVERGDKAVLDRHVTSM